MRRKDRKIQDNSWNIETTDSGAQNWVRYQKGIINEGGLNNNPVKRRKKSK